MRHASPAGASTILATAIRSAGFALALFTGIEFQNFPGALSAANSVIQTQNDSISRGSSDGLKLQLEAILTAAQKKDSKRLDDLISELKIQDSSWFSSEFGADAGAKLEAAYVGSWEKYEDSLTNIFQDCGQSKSIRVSVMEFSSSAPPSKDVFVAEILQNAKVPLQLYRAVANTNRRGQEALPGLYAYEQGAFRIISWSTFYSLPNVRPFRIRVGGMVSQANLVHQVSPVLPPGTPEAHRRGTVVLHVIIDRDGNVAQAEAVSGPADLAPSAISAVRQWRYKPTLLNGDPVEVDTTVTINFTATQ